MNSIRNSISGSIAGRPLSAQYSGARSHLPIRRNQRTNVRNPCLPLMRKVDAEGRRRDNVPAEFKLVLRHGFSPSVIAPRCLLPSAVACCLQPATSPRETFGSQRGAAGTLLCKVSGAYHQVEPELVRAGTLNLANSDEVVKDTAGNEVLIPNGNAKRWHEHPWSSGHRRVLIPNGNAKHSDCDAERRYHYTVLIPNGNAKLEHFVFMNLLYHDIRILSMRNLLNRPNNLVNLMGKGELYTF